MMDSPLPWVAAPFYSPPNPAPAASSSSSAKLVAVKGATSAATSAVDENVRNGAKLRPRVLAVASRPLGANGALDGPTTTVATSAIATTGGSEGVSKPRAGRSVAPEPSSVGGTATVSSRGQAKLASKHALAAMMSPGLRATAKAKPKAIET